MKPIHEFLAELDRKQIKFKIEGQQLRVRASKQALTPTVMEQLRLRKDEILAFLRRQPAKEAGLQAVVRPAVLPLSYAQERLWFLAQMEGPSATYNIPFALRLCGVLDPTALVIALGSIVQRHEVLRTTFPAVDGVAQQVIAPSLEVGLPLIDLSQIAESEQESAVQRQLAEAAEQPFDLAVGPLIRATLYHLAEQEHILLITLHHIVGDGWSLGILLRELDVCYRAALEGKPLPLPPLPYQYADFAIWQRNHLQGQVWQQQLSWWQQQLAGVPKLLELPTDYARPAVQSTQGGTLAFTLDVTLTSALEALSQQMGVSLFMTLYAAFAVLLMRYSGQDDMVIGTPIANRHHREVEPLIGFFVNTLPLRVDLSGNPSFRELLQRVRQVTLDAYAHQDLPFEQLVNELQIERSLSYSPLFQVMISVEYTLSHPASEPQPLGELTATRVEIEQVPAQFDLSLEMVKSGDRLQGWLDYSARLFKPDTIKRMASHFQELLQSIVADPQQSIQQLPLLTAAERHQILVEWNATQTDYPKEKCIQEFFEEQVERTPDSVAVVFEDRTEHLLRTQQLTYRELNARANQLAHYLRGLGVGTQPAKGDLGTEALVGIYVERSLEMIIAILGVLKAGAAYLPIDPTYPTERVNFILEDAQPLVVVTQNSLVAELPTKQNKTIKTIKTICLDRDQSQIAQQTTTNLKLPTTPDNAAYVIYTSGSTGRPKGVIIEQRNLVNYVCMFINEFGLRMSDRAILRGSISFDVSVEEIFPTLCVGATLVICANPKEVDTLVDEIVRHKITLLSTTPLIVQHLNNYADEITDLRMVISGGGVLQPTYIDRLLAHDIGVYNVYGPTETTVTSGSYKVEQLVDPLPIGQPVANTQFYVLDEYLQPVPIGVPGELYIGGAGVGRSYLNRPELTTQKFISWELRTDSSDDSLTRRLYKSGDLVRWRPDGLMEFLGRIDHQVKIRGFRIELGEIEAILCQHSLVQEAVVITHKGTAKDKRLVAYVTKSPKSESEASSAGLSLQEYLTQSLREYLREKLPEYMIPAIFMILDALPLTTNRKIDRKALPAPTLPALMSTFARPRTLTEQNLVAVWREVLQVEQVGIYDNFFDLGGHSLLAVRLMAQMRPLCGQQLPLQILFQHPTVAALASYLQQADESLSWSTLVALQPQGERAPFFCVPGDGGNVFYFYPLVQALGNQQPFYGLESLGLDGRTPPHATVEEAAAYHINLLKHSFPQGPYYLGGHSFGGLVAFEMAQQLCKAGETIALLAIMDTNAPSMPLQSFSEVELMIIFEHLFSEEYGYPPSLTHELLEPLPSEERLLRLKLALEQIGALPSESTLTEVKGLFNVFKTNAQMSYLPQAERVIPLPIQLFLAEEQPLERRQEIINGWSALGQVNVHIVPGTHTTMTYPPHVQILAQKLAACLEVAYTN